MALLTRDERKNLTKEEKKALRAQRRAERPKKGLRLNINWDGLLKSAESMILDWADEIIPGPEKMDEVCDQLASEADSYLSWGDGVFGSIMEAIDGPIISALFSLLIRPSIQKLYDRMKDDGKL